MNETPDTSEPLDLSAPYRRARALLAEMFVGKWRYEIPAELRQEAGLLLFGHNPDDDQLP
jgi:hypothetical protein